MFAWWEISRKEYVTLKTICVCIFMVILVIVYLYAHLKNTFNNEVGLSLVTFTLLVWAALLVCLLDHIEQQASLSNTWIQRKEGKVKNGEGNFSLAAHAREELRLFTFVPLATHDQSHFLRKQKMSLWIVPYILGKYNKYTEFLNPHHCTLVNFSHEHGYMDLEGWKLNVKYPLNRMLKYALHKIASFAMFLESFS